MASPTTVNITTIPITTVTITTLTITITITKSQKMFHKIKVKKFSHKF